MSISLDRAAIISTGAEILQGQYADTNARFLAEKLTLLGCRVVRMGVVGDEPEGLTRILQEIIPEVDLIICTGGLGPTEDDRNRDVYASVFGTSLVRNEQAIDMMRQRFASRGYDAMPASNEVQALVPSGAEVFMNEWGTAPGFYVAGKKSEDGKTLPGLIALPGPPSEMIPMFTKSVEPLLASLRKNAGIGQIRTIKTFGQAESEINDKVSDLFGREPNVEFTILAKPYGVELRICARSQDSAAGRAKLDEYEDMIRKRLVNSEIYGIDDDTLSTAVGRLLKARGATVSTAESCNGGLVGKMLTDVPGSSDYVLEGHITYSNSAKMRVLSVKNETLKAYGAVSEQTAREMAEGARAISGSTYALSTTGLSGPGGGSEQKPVGLTYMALATEDGTHVIRQQFLGDRKQNRRATALYVINLLRLELEKSVREQTLSEVRR